MSVKPDFITTKASMRVIYSASRQNLFWSSLSFQKESTSAAISCLASKIMLNCLSGFLTDLISFSFVMTLL